MYSKGEHGLPVDHNKAFDLCGRRLGSHRIQKLSAYFNSRGAQPWVRISGIRINIAGAMKHISACQGYGDSLNTWLQKDTIVLYRTKDETI